MDWKLYAYYIKDNVYDNVYDIGMAANKGPNNSSLKKI